MKAIAYVRVSTKEQDNKYQIDKIKAECKKRDLTFIEEPVFGIDEKISGKIQKRKSILDLMEHLKNHPEIDYVVISEITRLGRSYEVFNIIEDFHKLGVGLITVKEGHASLDKNKKVDSNAMLFFTFVNGIGIYELSTMQYRTRAGIKRILQEGKVGGGHNLPYGYTKGKHNELIIDKKESEIVERIFNSYVNGKGTYKIAEELNEEEIPTKRNTRWNETTIQVLLKNPVYIGKRRYRIDDKEKGTKPVFELFNIDSRIIEDDIFNRVQERFSIKTNRQGIHKHNTYLIDDNKIICGVCGQPYKPHSCSKSRFFCKSQKIKINPCDNYGISIEKFEKAINILLINQFKPILLKKLDNKGMKERIVDCEKKIELLNLNKEKLIDEKRKVMKLELKYGAELVKKEYDIVVNKEKTLEKTMKELQKELESLKVVYEGAKDLDKQEANIKEGGTLPRDVVNKIIQKIIVNPVDYKDLCKHKLDKVIRLDISAISSYLGFFISQRADYMELTTGERYKI